MRKLSFFASAACLLTAVVSTASAQPKVEEAILAPALDSTNAMSDTGLHYAAVVAKGSRFVQVVDGVEGPTLDRRPIQGSLFSPDGKRFAYVGNIGTDAILFLDGKEVARKPLNDGRDSPFGTLSFSKTGKRFWYVLTTLTPGKGDAIEYRLVMDGQPGEAYSTALSEGKIVFSPDETRFAHLARRLTGDQTRDVLVIDGKDVGFQGNRPQFSPDGKNVITIVDTATESVLLINGRPGSRAPIIYSAHVSTGGLNLLVMGTDRRTGSQMFLGTAGKKLEGSECQDIAWVKFSPDGKRYAALCRLPTNDYMVFIDGKKGRNYATISDFTFSADSTKAIYTATSGGGSFVVVENDEFEGGLPYVLGAGGKRIGYLIGIPMSRDSRLMIDGKTATYKSANYFGFSPDASRYALSAGDLNFPLLHVDGVEQKGVGLMPPMNLRQGQVPFSFSPDNKHVGHFGFVNSQTDKRGLVLDGKLVEPMAQLLAGPFFTPDSKHVFYLRPTIGAWELRVDGKTAVKFSSSAVFTGKDSYEMSADGVFTLIANADNSLKRFRVTAPADTSVDSFIAEVEAAEAKLVADAAAKKKADDDAIVAKKKKADDDKAAADAAAIAAADARKKKLDDDRAAAALKAKAKKK